MLTIEDRASKEVDFKCESGVLLLDLSKHQHPGIQELQIVDASVYHG